MKNYKESFRPWSSHEMLQSWVEQGARVLDVGCGTGYLAQGLQRKGCTVYGIDQDQSQVDRAKERGVKATCISVTDAEALQQHLGKGATFDFVVCADILEHVTDPKNTLEMLKQYVGGKLLISLPNVAHWSVRWGLLRGEWRYQDSGILDRTHVHFFTRETARELLKHAGYKIVREEFTPHPMLVPKGMTKHAALHTLNYRFTKIRPSLLAMQFLFETQPR